MRLIEFKMPSEVVQNLTKQGYEYLGHGNFTQVYAKPGSDKVVRIGDGRDGWTAYADLCRRTSNPHFPKIYKLGFRSDGHFDGLKIVVAVMERLIKIDNDSKKFAEENPALTAYIVRKTAPLWWGTANWAYGGLVVPAALDGVNWRDKTAYAAWADQAAESLEPTMKAALDAISQLRGVDFDFKPDNFMRRSDGTLVITDPVW